MKILPLVLIYSIYLLPDFAVFFLPLIPIFFGISSVKLSVQTFWLFSYILLVLLVSLVFVEDRYLFNLISSGKLLIFLIFFIFLTSCRGIFYQNFENMESSYINFSFAFLLGSWLLTIFTDFISFVGHRGDIGVFLSLFSFFHISRYVFNRTGKNLFLMLSFLLLLSLLLQHLQGRTAFGVLGFLIVCGSIFGMKRRGRINILISLQMLIYVSLIVALGVQLIISRGGIEYLINSEARLLALVYWYHAISDAGWLQILFGHGYGQCVDQLTFANDFVREHVEQIMGSSGGGCYVSWGFHNAFLSLFFEIGVVGTLLMLIFIWYNLSRVNFASASSKLMFLGLLIVASPNNHLFNHDIFGALLFAALAFFHNVSIIRQKR